MSGNVVVTAVLAGLCGWLLYQMYEAVQRGRARRGNRRQGGPDTDHLVEILDVRPAPGAEEIEPYLVAVCDDDECGWLEFPADGLDRAGEETHLRAEAARHSSNVAHGMRRPIG